MAVGSVVRSRPDIYTSSRPAWAGSPDSIERIRPIVVFRPPEPARRANTLNPEGVSDENWRLAIELVSAGVAGGAGPPVPEGASVGPPLPEAKLEDQCNVEGRW